MVTLSSSKNFTGDPVRRGMWTRLKFMNSLRSRMTVLILLGVIPVILIALRLEGFQAAQIIHQESQQILDLEAQKLSDRLIQWNRMNTLLVQNLSRQPGISEMNPQQLTPILRSTHQTYQDMVWSIAIANLDGQFIALSEQNEIKPINFSDRGWFQGAIQGQAITEETIISRRTNEPAVIFSAPIYHLDNNSETQTLQGVIRVGITLTEMTQAVGLTSIGETGFAFLVDETGQLLAHPYKELVNGETLNDFSTFPPVQQLLQGKEGFLHFEDNEEIPWLARTVQLPNGWGLVVMQQESEAFRQERSYRQLAIRLSLLSIIIVGGITWYFSGWVTKPLTDLTQAASKLSRGEWNQRVQFSHNDELGSLARTFNRMATQLQHSFTEIEKAKDNLEIKVEERTQKLNSTLQELKQAQAQMVQSEKMSSLGQMVAGVAHEINNPVSFIHGNLSHAQAYAEDLLSLVELYREHYPDPPAAIEEELEAIEIDFLTEDFGKTLKSMQLGTVRIREIVKSLRTFSRLDEAEVKEVDIHEGLESTLMILQNRLRCCESCYPIQVIKSYQELPLITCYSGQLNQVFMNLLANAIDAVEDRNHEYGREALQDDPSTIWIETAVLDSNWISIRIRDNGFGIPEEVQSRLFDPFFTTKPIGKGTGLGLSISYQVVTQRHGGHLSFNSTSGEGTEFIIKIPVQQSAIGS